MPGLRFIDKNAEGAQAAGGGGLAAGRAALCGKVLRCLLPCGKCAAIEGFEVIVVKAQLGAGHFLFPFVEVGFEIKLLAANGMRAFIRHIGNAAQD